jgi:flavin-dependent thymidylate synthase
MKNKVELIGWYGGDKAIARAAWTSTQIDVDAKTDEQIKDLLVNKLWNNGSGKPHKTPFERGIVEFNITCEQASHIHLLKHRLANINGESARYKELKEDKYYLPEDLGWNQEMKTTNMSWVEKLAEFTEEGNKLYHQCLEELTPVLGRKRAKESARFFKTMNSQLTLSVMMNMSCFSNFYTLRHDEAAQKEIQWIAAEMLECVKNIEGNPFQHSLAAFGY